jgi:hypothetical protein
MAMTSGHDDLLLFAGRLGALRPEDVLQFVAHTGLAVHVAFESPDPATGAPRAVDLILEGGRWTGLGPRGTGLRLGDLAVARGILARRELEALLADPDGDRADAAEMRVGERLVAAGRLAPEDVDDLLWERHARVLWSLAAWDGGHFRVCALDAAARAAASPVDPPLAVDGVLLDGLQRAEAVLAPVHDEAPLPGGLDALAGGSAGGNEGGSAGGSAGGSTGGNAVPPVP